MKRTSYTVAVALLSVLAFAAVALAAIPVEVSVGKGTIITLKKNAKRVSLTDPAVADLILISPRELLINGKKVGTTSMITWDAEGKRTFFDVNVFGDIAELRKQIAAIAADDDVSVERAADAILLKGTLKNEETLKKIATLTKTYAPKVVNFLKVAEAQQVLLEVRVVQIERSKLKELGISFLAKGNDAEVTSPGFVASPDGTIEGDAPGIGGFDLADFAPQIGVAHFKSGIGAVLRALSSKGLAKILAEPNLVVRSGEKGSFLAGSRVPIQQVTGVNQTVTFVFEEVGVRLNFAPVVLENGVIRLKIDPAEVSAIGKTLRFGEITVPEFITNTVKTNVDLKDGESLVLAGLLNEKMRKNIQKIPLLGDIPILGALFRSTSDEIERTELAFFITPKLIKPLQPGEEPADWPEEITPEEEREFEWIPLGPPMTSKEAKAGN